MKFGILGYGSIGYRHATNLRILGHEVQVYDPNGYDCDRDNLIRTSDAIVVASPTKMHVYDMICAVEAEKHVFVEKPFGYDCSSYTEGYLKRAHTRHGSSLIVAAGFNLRFHDCVMRCKAILKDNKSLGAVQSASFSVLQKSERPEYLRDGVIRNWACHEMDVASHLFGSKLEVVDCQAEHNAEGKDQTWCIIDMKHPDIPGIIRINADYTTDPEQRFFWIKCEKATIYVNMLDRTLHIDNDGMTIYDYKGQGSFDRDYQQEMLHFANSCKVGRHMAPLATGWDGVHNLYHIMKARELARVT